MGEIKANPENCETFRKCVSNIIGSPFGAWTTLNCENDLMFNSATNKCVIASQSDCSKFYLFLAKLWEK